MTKRTRNEIVLLRQEHGGMLIHLLPDVPLEHYRVVADVECMEQLVTAHDLGDDAAGTLHGPVPQSPE